MRGMSKKDALACQVSLGLFAGLLGIASTAHGAPIADGGGVNHDGVRAGSAAISQSGTTTNITSGSLNNVIGWKDFSVKSGETVQFDGGANTNNYLNIVTGNVTSQINGAMKGGKNVYIANSHGVVFGDGASVDVGSLYVTTRKLDADAIGTSVGNGTINLDTPASAGVTGNIINGSAASSAGLAESDIVSLVDSSGSVKANTIVLEGKSVRIMNDAKIDSPDVSAVADQSALEVDAGGMKTVRANKGYVHVGYVSSAPTYGSTGKYKNLTDANMYKLVGSKADLDAIRTTAGGLAGRYMLRNDIDFGGTAHTSIGTNADPFTGKFDGMFHEIKNMTVASGNATDYAGLFGNTSGAEIANVGIRDANMSTLDYGGAVVGKADNSTRVFNVYNEVTGTAPAATKMIGASTSHEAGGLVGRLEASSLDNAYNTAPIAAKAGGITGFIQGSSQVYAVYNTGALNGTAGAVYYAMGGPSFIKEAYTTQGNSLGAADNTINAYDSYATSTGKAELVNTTKVTASPLSSAINHEDAKQASSYNKWDISDEGGANKTWRIFAGQSNPLLTAFMQGTVQAEYSYADFEQAGHAHSGNVSNTYTNRIPTADGTIAKNNGKSIPERTYDATYRKITKADGTEVQNVSDVNIVGYTAPAASDPKEIKLDADHGRRNAGKTAVLYGGQHGYDVAGANVTIKKRSVKAGLGTDRPIEREYDGTTDMTQAFKNALTGISTEGLVAGDDVAIDTVHSTLAASVADANAGYGKALTLSGTLTYTGNDRVNYEDIDAASGALTLPSGLTGNIRQKKVTVGLDTTKDYSKIYDGTSAVKSGVDPKTTNDVLQLTGVVGSEDLKLNYNDITAKYMTGKTASDTERKNAGTNIDIAYKNIKLADGTTGLARNYRLVDAAGNVLYRDSLTGEPTDMTNAANSANPRYIGAATTTGGTLWGAGDIKKRKIDPTKFSVTGGADKVYNGTDYLVVDGTTKKVTGPAAVANTDTNIVASDAGKISFSISAPDNKAYYVQGDRTTRTKNAYVNDTDGAKYLSYTLKAHNETSEDVLSNYELDKGSGEALAEGSIHTVTGDGKITPRTVYVDLLKKTGINKEYDKDVNVLAADKQFGTNFGYRAAAANENKLVKEDGAADDGAQITATAAVYKTKSGHTEQDYEVYRTGNALTGAVEDNGKDVEYTIGLTGDHAATNYVLSYTPSGGGATQTSSSVTMTGTGKITPKKLTIAAPGDVTRSYDTTSNVYAKQLKDLGYDHVTNGVLGGDTVNLALGADNAVVGKYYTDNTKATAAENANARPNGSFLPGQTYYTVNYTFTPTLDNGNYEVANTVADGRGKITQFQVTNANFNMDFGDVTKTFDGTTAVSQSAGLSALNITLENGNVVDFLATNSYTMAGKEYADKHANTDRSGALLSGKQKIDVTYKVRLPGGGAGNYDLSGIGGGDYTLTGDMYSGYTVARKKAAGYIKPKEVLATVAKPNVTKTYNRDTDVLDEHGQASGGSAIVNMPDLVLGNGSNISEGAYDNVHAGTGKTVTYTLKVSSGYENDYYFVSTPGGASITTLTGQGTINPRAIDVEFKQAVKNYDGTSDVKFTGTAPAWGYTLKALNDDADKSNTEAFLAADNPTLNTAAGTTLKGHYVDEHGAHQSDAGTYTNLVQYSGIKNALSSGDYTIADSKKGSGTINKRQVNAGDFNLAFAGVTKVYDATKDVKKNGDAAQADGYIGEVSVDLGGTVGKKRFTAGNGYTLVKAEYADPNVTVNQGTGNVTYTLKLDSGLLKNYSFADLNNAAGQAAGYSYDSANNTVTRTLGVGTITKRPVYALTNGNVSKTYDAATTVLGADKSVLTGDGLLKLGNKRSDGTIVQDAGIVEINGTKYGTNVSTAKYADKNYGEGTKMVNYTLKIDPAYASNYEFFDARTGTAVNPDASNNYIISTTTNTIKKAALTVRQDPGSPISKSYDGGTAVEDGDGRLLLDNGLTDEDGQQDQVSLNPYPAGATPPANAYTLTYNSPNVTNAATAKNNVTYKHLQLTGQDAGNYYLADAGGTALAADTTAGYFTMTGDGAITPLKVTNQNLVFDFAPTTKEYDGNAKVGGTDNAATWKSYITNVYIKKADGTELLNLRNDIEKVNKAEYQAGGGSRAKDAATGKKVLFNVKFKDEMLNNLEFDNSIYTPDAQGNHMLSDKTYDRYTTGDITKKLLTATLDQSANLRKVYDGTTDADKENLKIAGKLDGDSLTYGKTAVYNDENANINPNAASQNGRVITYTSTLGGTDAVNYAFDNAGANTKTLTATGDIEKRKVYASVNQDVRKKYDGTTKVKINGAVPATGDSYVTFGKSSNAAEADTTGLVTGRGTNATTAAYQDANAGTNKQVDYTLAIGGDDGNGHNYKDNYVIYDANRPTVMVTTLSTYKNIIDKAALMLNAAYADKQYDGTRTVKNLGTMLTLTGAPTGIGIQTGYAGTYLDENVNEKGVDYSNVRLSGTGASNYTLSYDGNDLTPDAGGSYSFHGSGRITKRVIDGDANLKVGFTGAPISKVYDGTAKVTGDAARFVNSVYVEYTEGGTTKRVAMTKKVDSADYKDTVGRPGSGKNAAGEKDVTFKFTLDDKNFNLANLTGVTEGTAADGTKTFHYTRDYDRDASGKALGEIKKRNVLLTVNHVQKIYDGTNAVRDGHYDADGTEHANVFSDVTKTLTLQKAERNADGTLKDDKGLVESDGAVLDVANINAHYEDNNPGDAADANRSLTGRDASGYKKVAYTVRLKGDGTVADPNENYTFVNASGTDITELDAGTGKKDRVVGTGDIWRKKLTVAVTPDADKIYDQNAVVKDATAQSHLYLAGQENGENVQFDNTSFDTAHNNNAVRAYYGKKDENNVFTQNEHVNRDADGNVINRDVQYRNLQPAFDDLKTRNNAAKNYFVQEQEVFGAGKITPLAVTANDVRRVWRGHSFSKTYDGKTDAMISGKTMTSENKGDFKRKLDLILGLSTGEQINLDYTMYGEDDADAKELRPHYDDKNVKNSDGVTTDKDMIYTLKGLKSIKELVKNNQNVDYDYSALATAFGDGTQVRLKGAGSETPDNTAAMITPKKVEVAAPYISKTYDATVNIPAGAVAGWTQADLVADEETRTMMAKDKVTVEVDATGSKFLAADGVTESADASADPGETVNGKRVKYQINLQSTAANPAVETGNYEFSTGGNTVVGKGDIMRRMVHVVADDTKAPVDKMYDGDDYVRNADGTIFKRKFKLEDAVSGDTGILAPDAGRVNLANDEAEGHFASPTGSKYGSEEVERDANGNVINKDVVYKGFTLSGTASNNYIVAERDAGYKQANAAKITPREIDLSLKNPNVTKEYDGTKAVKDNAAGNFLTDNIDKTDNNPVYNALTLPTLNQESAEYADENAGANKGVKYELNWKDGNYTFKGANVTASSLPDANGVYKVSITTDTAAITKRKVDVTAANAQKTYDATTRVNDAWNNLKSGMKHHGDNETAIIDKDKKALEDALTGSYNDKNAGNGKNVTYTFDDHAAVMNNYEFANSGTSTYGNTVTGEGTIDRRHLQVVSDSKLVTAGRGAENFTGRIKDGVNPGAATSAELDGEINELNDGRFSYGPAGEVNCTVPGRYDIHGWYMNGSSRTLAQGDYGQNFILDEVPGTLAVAPVGQDNVDRRLRPDDKVYVYASYDENDTFGASRMPDASLAYQDKGVNTGRTTIGSSGAAAAGMQQGTETRPQGGKTAARADGSSSAADRGLAKALGQSKGNAAYYNGKGFSKTDDDEEEEIRRKARVTA